MNEYSDSTARPENTASSERTSSMVGQIAAAAWDSMRENSVTSGRIGNGVKDGETSLVITNPYATNEQQQATADIENPISSSNEAGSEQEKLSPVDKALTKMFADQHLDGAELKRLRSLLNPECNDDKPSKPKPGLHGLK